MITAKEAKIITEKNALIKSNDELNEIFKLISLVSNDGDNSFNYMIRYSNTVDILSKLGYKLHHNRDDNYKIKW